MSENYKLQLIDKSSFRLSLEKVRYDSLKTPGDLSSSVSFVPKTKDSYKISEITEDKVELEFERKRFFEPAGIFNIEITIKMKYRLQSETRINKKKEKVIREDFEADFKRLLAPAAAYASLIMSSLSIVNLKVPIIDPPFPIEDKN